MKDELFKTHTIKHFCFDAQVAAVFDDMLERSIPFYASLLSLVSDFVLRLLPSGASLVDLGSSTGNLLLQIALKARAQGREIRLVGIDNSPDMLKLARLKADALGVDVEFVCADMLDYAFGQADCFVCNYTLQFIAPQYRLELLKKIYDFLNPNGILIFSEKIYMTNILLNEAFIEQYHHYKQAQGYSLGEIAKKREALENVLVPNTHEQNLALLENAGFRTMQILFAWVNFQTIVALKEE
ncbi:MAG: carboxy-S-adenosyl-L-methionine synthase CmoA [Helicobacter sp.]|nr:carboxy-S-adenosyl-L-methionine synthase CmoA [Helicobacter sp.]